MTATSKPKTLHDFEGRKIDRATIKIVGAGDGLSDALAIDPEEIELGEDRYFVLRGSCGRVSIETDKNGVTARVHTIKTAEITMLEGKMVKDFLTAAADNLARAKSELEGQMQLQADDDLEGKEALATIAETGSLAPEFKGE